MDHMVYLVRDGDVFWRILADWRYDWRHIACSFRRMETPLPQYSQDATRPVGAGMWMNLQNSILPVRNVLSQAKTLVSAVDFGCRYSNPSSKTTFLGSLERQQPSRNLVAVCLCPISSWFWLDH